MDTIAPFWVGARAHAGPADLITMAQAVGGWDTLASCGAADLVDLGVAAESAERWTRARSEQTLGRAFTLADPDYPPMLRRLPTPPPVVCVEGDVQALAVPAVAIVGTRRCTPYGAAVARHLGGAVAVRGVPVVSGLARGIDGHAHRAAVEVGRSIAVLGHGLEFTSPASHRGLRRELQRKGGAVLSSFPDSIRPARWTFPLRNRWIAGLAEATVVVEAPLRSGALITATEAAAVGREVFAVPGPLGAPASAGCLALLAQGASLIDDVEGFASRFGPGPAPPADPLLGAVAGGASVDQIARRLGRPVTEVMASLARLEVEGRVVRLAGSRFALSGVSG